MANKPTKLATSGTKEGIIKLINQYFYTDDIRVDFETGEIFNSKGKIDDFSVVFKKGRYIFQ